MRTQFGICLVNMLSSSILLPVAFKSNRSLVLETPTYYADPVGERVRIQFQKDILAKEQQLRLVLAKIRGKIIKPVIGVEEAANITNTLLETCFVNSTATDSPVLRVLKAAKFYESQVELRRLRGL